MATLVTENYRPIIATLISKRLIDRVLLNLTNPKVVGSSVGSSFGKILPPATIIVEPKPLISLMNSRVFLFVD